MSHFKPFLQSKSFNATGKPVFFNSCEWVIHGHGWDSMPTHGGVDRTTMIHGLSHCTEQLASLSTMQTWENMQVC